MNLRTTYILLGVVGVGLLILLLVFSLGGSKGKNAPKIEGYLIQSLRAADIKASDIESLEIEKAGNNPEKIVFVRDKGLWNIVSPIRGKADAVLMNNLLNDLFEARTEKNAELGTMEQHGLDAPGVKLTLKAKSLTTTISLGNITIGGDSALVYVHTPDRGKRPVACTKKNFKLLIRSDAPDKATKFVEICKGLNEFRPLGLLGDYPDPLMVTRAITIKQGKQEISLELNKDGTWRFTSPKELGEAEVESSFDPKNPKENASTSSIRALLGTLQGIRPADAKDFLEPKEGLSKYGLDPTKDPVMTIALSRTNGDLDILYIGADVPDMSQDRVFARPEADSMVVKVNATAVRDVKRLFEDPNRLRSRTLARLDTKKVDAIDIEMGGQTTSFRRLPEGWFTYLNGKRRPVSNAVFELLDKLVSPNLLRGFPKADLPEDRRGFSNPSAVVKVWEGGIMPDTKTDAKDPKESKVDPNVVPKVQPLPTVVVRFGQKETGNVVLVRRESNGEKLDAFAPLELAALAERKPFEYVGATLPAIDPNSVLKLNFLRQRENIEVENTTPDKPLAQSSWKLNAPAALKDRNGDLPNITNLLNKISTFTKQPPRVHAEKPLEKPEELLNRLELNPANPRGMLQVKLKDGTEKIIYLGGDCGGDNKRVFCTTNDTDLILEVDREVFDLCQTIDVQDAVVHRIDKTKLKGVKITGWSDIVGTPLTLEFERKDGAWVGKGVNYAIDAPKLDAFLDTLMAPRAESFLVVKSGPRPEDNLDVNKGAMTIVLEGDKVITITLASPDKEGRIRATSSEISGDVFILKDQFANVRAKPAYFKKD